jgi:hypothetical protein
VEAPNFKLQPPEKLQMPSSKSYAKNVWNLKLGISLELGCWMLKFYL